MKYIINHSVKSNGQIVHTITNEAGKVIATRTSASKTFNYALIECFRYDTGSNASLSSYIESVTADAPSTSQNTRNLHISYATVKVPSARAKNYAIAYSSNI